MRAAEQKACIYHILTMFYRITLGNNSPHFHVQFGAGMLLCEVGQQYGVIPHIGISSCLVVRGVFPQSRYVLG